MKTETEWLKQYVKECGGIYSAAILLSVNRSTLIKALKGKRLSEPTVKKISSIMERKSAGTDIPGPVFNKAMFSNRKQIGLNSAQTIEASLKLGIDLSDMKKILEGEPVSCSVADTVRRAFEDRTELSEIFFRRPSMVVKLLQVYDLYKKRGTLEGAGKELGLTRERVRQMLLEGSRLGLFKYNGRTLRIVPKEKIIDDFKRGLNFGDVARENHIAPDTLRKLIAAYNISPEGLRRIRVVAKGKIPKEKILDDFKGGLNFTQVARGNHIARDTLRKLVAAYDIPPEGLFSVRVRVPPKEKIPKEKILQDFRKGSNQTEVARANHISTKVLRELIKEYDISDEEILSLRVEGHKARCIDEYYRIKKELGHHPTKAELEDSRLGWLLPIKIGRLWGSWDAFRKELKFPTETY